MIATIFIKIHYKLIMLHHNMKLSNSVFFVLNYTPIIFVILLLYLTFSHFLKRMHYNICDISMPLMIKGMEMSHILHPHGRSSYLFHGHIDKLKNQNIAHLCKEIISWLLA